MRLVIRTPEEIAAAAQTEQQAQRRLEAHAFLASTDWMVTRFVETGVAIPEAVRAQRAAARALVSSSTQEQGAP